MNSLEKLGYILIGVGLGGLISTVLYEHELNKPIGEVEEYIPKSDTDDENDISETIEDPDESEKDIDSLAEMYSPSSENEFDSRSSIDRASLNHSRKTRRTPYSTMYKMDSTNDERDLEFADDDEIVQCDIPNDDESYEDDLENLDNELVRERVENEFEIYLGENPQDFVTLIFYQGDSTMTDDQEQLVPNPDDVVGHVAIRRLIEGGPGAEEGVIYVRNLKTMINYEIVLDAGSYKDTVLGIFNSRRNNGADRRGDT